MQSHWLVAVGWNSRLVYRLVEIAVWFNGWLKSPFCLAIGWNRWLLERLVAVGWLAVSLDHQKCFIDQLNGFIFFVSSSWTFWSKLEIFSLSNFDFSTVGFFKVGRPPQCRTTFLGLDRDRNFGTHFFVSLISRRSTRQIFKLLKMKNWGEVRWHRIKLFRSRVIK